MPPKRIVLKMPPKTPSLGEQLEAIFKLGGYDSPNGKETLAAKCIPQSLLGKGGFGIVERVVYKEDSKMYALKTCSFFDDESFEFARKEITYHEAMIHENLCKLVDYEISRRESKVRLLMELCEGGSLAQEIKGLKATGNVLPTDRVWKYFIQIVKGLHYMHNANAREDNPEFPGVLVHSDLKPENIFFADAAKQNLKIGDFGLVKHLDGKMSNDQSGTILYMAPEVILQKPSNEKADIFAAGLIAVEMMNGEHPYECFGHTDLVTVYSSMEDPFTEMGWLRNEGDSELLRLTRRMLSTNPEDRPSTTELLQDSAFQNRMLQDELSAALREVEELKHCEKIQVAVHKKVLQLEAARFKEALDKQAAAHKEELELQKLRHQQDIRGLVAANGRNVQAEFNQRRWAEVDAERVRADNAYHYERYQHYRQKYYAAAETNENLRHELSHARAPVYERRRSPECGPVRRAGHARDAAHPYRPAAPRYAACRFA